MAAAFCAGGLHHGYFSPVGLILLAMFAAYIICNAMAMKERPRPGSEKNREENASIFCHELGLLAFGAVLILAGCQPAWWTTAP